MSSLTCMHINILYKMKSKKFINIFGFYRVLIFIFYLNIFENKNFQTNKYDQKISKFFSQYLKTLYNFLSIKF